jgi:hypothetical protein
MTVRFAVYTYAAESDRKVWEGTPDDLDAPLAFIPEMREFAPLMVVGDRLTLGKWHYAVLLAH